MDLLIDLVETQEGVAHRPARLYKFDRKRYQKFLAGGFSFELKETRKKDAHSKKIISSVAKINVRS